MTRPGLLCLLALLLLAASCASDEQAVVDDRPEALAFDGAEPTSPVDDTVGGSDHLDLLRLALARPETTDPSAISLTDQAAVIVADLLYDGLTQADGDVLRPALATAWTANAEVTEWTFAIDTERVDPQHVVTHFQELRSTARGSLAVALANVTSVEAVGAIDADGAGGAPTGVRFVLDRPDAGLPWVLSGVGFGVVGEDGDPTSGYAVTASSDDAELVLDTADPTGTDVTIVWKETALDAYHALTLGIVDAAVAPTSSLDDAEARFGVTLPARAVARFLTVNGDSPRLADESVKRALLLAIDREGIVDVALGAPAFALDGLLAPTLVGYRRGGCGESCTPNPERATSLLASSPVGLLDEGVRIALAEGQAPLGAAIAADLEAVGLRAVVAEYPPAELATVLASGDAELFASGWIAPAPSIDAAVTPILREGSPAPALGSPDPETEHLLVEAAATLDDGERWALLAGAHERAIGSGQVIPIALAKSHLVTAPQARSVTVRADGTLEFEHASGPPVGPTE